MNFIEYVYNLLCCTQQVPRSPSIDPHEPPPYVNDVDQSEPPEYSL